VLVLSVRHNCYNLLVSLFVSSYLFRPLTWPSSGYLRGCYFLYYIIVHILHFRYTTIRPAIRDLLFSTGKLLVRVGHFNFSGRLFFFFSLSAAVSGSSVQWSYRISMSTIDVRFSVFVWCRCLWTGADPSVCIRVGTCVVSDIVSMFVVFHFCLCLCMGCYILLTLLGM
jgi:hypothetical protein